ncbi:ABC transporter permease [Ahniella affigens]|nr:ABC transporter permease [Ahniella affigens]
MREFQFALRRLLRHPWSSAAMLIGMGLSFAMVITTGALSRALLAVPDALPTADRVQLVTLAPEGSAGDPSRRTVWSYPAYQALQAAMGPTQSVEAVTLKPISLTVATPGGSVRAPVEIVSPGYFQALSVAPERGPGFSTSAAIGTQELVISALEWQRRFAGNPNIIGQSVLVQGVPFIVVGVLPAGFRGLSEQADYWLPMAAAPAVTFPSRLKGAQSFWHSVFIVDDQTSPHAAQWQAPAKAVGAAINLQQAGRPVGVQIATVSWRQWRLDPSLHSALRALKLCSQIMLAIVTLNLGMVGLARLSSRRRELGILAAVGATAWRLMLATTGELLLLLCAGLLLAWTIAGIVLAQLPVWFGNLLGSSVTPASLALDLPQLLNVGLIGLLVAALLIALAGGLGQLARTAELVRGGDNRPVQRWHSWIAGIQFALASALTLAAVLAAGLAWRSVQTPLGFDPENVLSAQISVPAALRPADGTAGAMMRIESAFQQAPGAKAIGAAGCLPVQGGCDFVNVTPAGSGQTTEWPAGLNQIDGAYLDAMGIRVFSGRSFNTADRADSQPVAIVNRSFVDRYLPAANALGQQVSVSVGWPESGSAEIVGVVDDTLGTDLDADPEPMIYLPMAQMAYDDNFVVIKLEPGTDVLTVSTSLEKLLARTEPNLALFDVTTMSQRFANLTERRRIAALLVLTITVLAVLLAAVGVFATFSLNMAQRRKELAVRFALGARVRDLRQLIVRQVLRFASVSALLGLGLGALFANRLAAQLPMLDQQVPTPYLLVLLIMTVTTVLAVWVPTRQALRAEPTEALKAGG